MSFKKYTYIIGIDEVGRGPLAGPVSVCAFSVKVKDQEKVQSHLENITDSKLLTPHKREAYHAKLLALSRTTQSVRFAVSHVSAKVIDRVGIVKAIRLALKRSLEKLNLSPSECYVYLDGGLVAPSNYAQETVIQGDQKIWQISAASVTAKVVRDKKMVGYAQKYPSYGFEKHKGYGTKFHTDAIKKNGITQIHRSSWIET